MCSFFNMLIKPKEEPRLSAEIDRLRASSSELSQISALLSDSNVPKSEGGNQISGDKVRLDLVLERLKTSEKVVPDLQLMNTFLRHFAIEGRAEEARSLLSRLSKDCTRDNQKRFFYFADGVRPVQESRELVAFAFLKAGNFQEANKIMVTFGQLVVWELIKGALRSDKQTVAWDLFNRLREKILPSPEISATMIMSCGKNDYVEKAFKVYKELLAQGLTPNSHTHSALIYAGSKRKEFYPQIVDLFKEMQSLGMSIDIRVYNHLLVGCGKVADLQTALSLWDQLCSGETNLFPTEVTVANMLWALASVETEVDKISLRQFHYDMNPEELKKNAEDVYDWAVSAGLPINGYVKNAFLAVMTNHVFVERAEQIFKDLVSGSNKDALPHSYELMLKLYDSAEDYPKSQALILNAQATGIKLSIEAWRAGVRTAALTDHLEESVETLQCMVNAGHRPSVKDIKALHLRLCENEKWTLKKRMDELCLPPVKPSINPFTTWRQRSVKLHNLLKDVYGKEAPSLTTKIDKGIDSGPL